MRTLEKAREEKQDGNEIILKLTQKYQNNRAENFSSANQVAEQGDETVQVSAPLTAFSLGLRNHFLTLPSGETSVGKPPILFFLS